MRRKKIIQKLNMAAGQLVNGKWSKQLTGTGLRQVNEKGEFVRTESVFRNQITAPGSGGIYEAEPNRYHLFVHISCPWAHRTLVTRAYLGLEDSIGISVGDSRTNEGWCWTSKAELIPIEPFKSLQLNCRKENKKFQLHQVYTAADPDATTRVTVPVLWDTKTNSIVNNESAEIIRMLNEHSRSFGAKNSEINLVPFYLRKEIDALNDKVYFHLNNGVYRRGFSKGDTAYHQARKEVFEGLEFLENRLQKTRYLFGVSFLHFKYIIKKLYHI